MLGFVPLPILPVLAQVDSTKEIEAMRDAAARNSKPSGLSLDLMFILGILLCLAAVLFFWAFFLRKRPRQARGALVTGHDRQSSSRGSGNRRRRRKRRPEHPDNWGRKPTLGETGGLPPSRPEEPESPSEPESPPAR